MWLSEKKLVALTGKKTPAAQARVLDEAIPPVPYSLVGGRIIVYKSDLHRNQVVAAEPQLRLVRT